MADVFKTLHIIAYVLLSVVCVRCSNQETLCDTLTSPENGHVKGTATSAKFSCKKGFHIVGSDSLTCTYDEKTRSYKWSGQKPNCNAEIDKIPATENDQRKDTAQTQESMPWKFVACSFLIIEFFAVIIVIDLVDKNKLKTEQKGKT